MITDSFLNSCFNIVLNKTVKIKKDKTLYRDILSVLTFHENQDQEVAANIQVKFDCLKKVCVMSLDDKSIDNILDSISFGERFKSLIDFLEHKRDEEIKDTSVIDNVNQIRLRKKLNSLFSNYKELQTFLEQLEEGSFDSVDDLVLDYEAIIKTLYSNMMNENRGVAIEASASLDLTDDPYDSVQQMILKKYERGNATPTGYPIFDNDILKGGFEPSRLYIFGGAPGSGKSTLLSNFINNAATMNLDPFESNTPSGEIENVYIYISLENTIEESLMRTYQQMFKIDQVQVLRDITEGVNIKQRIVDQLAKNKSTIIMKYFPAMSISSIDLMAVLDDAELKYGKGSIKGLYVDYLDLLKTDTKYDVYRLELGHITLSMKTLAVEYEIPVIMPTQLGRASYRVQSADELNMDQIAESVKKVEHADFLMMLTKDPVNENIVHARVGKNRSGPNNISVDFNVDFKHFSFLNGSKITNVQKKDSANIIETKADLNAYKLPDFAGLGGGL